MTRREFMKLVEEVGIEEALMIVSEMYPSENGDVKTVIMENDLVVCTF